MSKICSYIIYYLHITNYIDHNCLQIELTSVMIVVHFKRILYSKIIDKIFISYYFFYFMRYFHYQGSTRLGAHISKTDQ